MSTKGQLKLWRKGIDMQGGLAMWFYSVSLAAQENPVYHLVGQRALFTVSDATPNLAQTRTAQRKPQLCPADIDIVLGRAVVRLPERVHVDGASRDHLTDCSIKRVEGRSVYPGPGMLKEPQDFDRIGRPNGFEFHSVTTRYGLVFPRGEYALNQVEVDAIRADRYSLSDDGFLHQSEWLFVASPGKYATPTGEPFVVMCVRATRTTECRASYRLDDDLHLSYWFNPETVPRANWEALDRFMRQYAQSVRKK